MYAIIDIISIDIDEIWPTNLVIVIYDIIKSTIPIVTAIKELILCFTTSEVFSQSNFGYFKFTINPI